jgi:ribonuclease HI
MLQRHILSGRLGKWAMKGQVVVDFIVEHNVELDNSVCMVEEHVWKMFFDGSVRRQGQGVGWLIVSPHGIQYELLTHWEFECTNNQVEYEVLLNGLEALNDLGVDKVGIFGDSKLVVEQVNGNSQCLDNILNEYQEHCMDMMSKLEKVNIKHIPREDNARVNKLAQ